MRAGLSSVNGIAHLTNPTSRYPLPVMPTQQKALLLPEKQGDWIVGPAEVPKPGPGQLLVKVEATALNPIDWKIQVYGWIIEAYPSILGSDGAGIVEEVGEGVLDFAVGDKV